MSVGPLLAVYAYEVAPRQSAPFAGGVITPTPELQAALDTTFDRSGIEAAPAVTFEVDSTSVDRAHPIRDVAIALAAQPHNCVGHVETLAARLASAMDNRSKPSLLVVSVHEKRGTEDRRVLLWTFPQQQVFSLRATSGQASLELLEAFNRESNLRKAALVDGHSPKTGFLTARVLDFQASATERTVAELWIGKFLAARLQMSDTEGTQVLARALRSAYTKTVNNQRAQDQILAAITALRVKAPRRWSVQQVADTYMDTDAAEAFTGSVRPEERRALFGIDPARLEELVQYRRFTLANGVVVSAPFGSIGEGLGVAVAEDGGTRNLRAEGRIIEEQVRAHV